MCLMVVYATLQRGRPIRDPQQRYATTVYCCMLQILLNTAAACSGVPQRNVLRADLLYMNNSLCQQMRRVC